MIQHKRYYSMRLSHPIIQTAISIPAVRGAYWVNGHASGRSDLPGRQVTVQIGKGGGIFLHQSVEIQGLWIGEVGIRHRSCSPDQSADASDQAAMSGKVRQSHPVRSHHRAVCRQSAAYLGRHSRRLPTVHRQKNQPMTVSHAAP